MIYFVAEIDEVAEDYAKGLGVYPDGYRAVIVPSDLDGVHNADVRVVPPYTGRMTPEMAQAIVAARGA